MEIFRLLEKPMEIFQFLRSCNRYQKFGFAKQILISRAVGRLSSEQSARRFSKI
jgi:hypothetical protein